MEKYRRLGHAEMYGFFLFEFRKEVYMVLIIAAYVFSVFCILGFFKGSSMNRR